MDTTSLKIELAKRILETESAELLEKLLQVFKNEEKDFAALLTEQEKEEIEISRRQIDDGETESWDSIKKRLL
jgi:hypothetical protein